MCTEEGACDHLSSCLGSFISLGLSLSIAGISVALCFAGAGLPLLNRLLPFCSVGILHLQSHAFAVPHDPKQFQGQVLIGVKNFNASRFGRRAWRFLANLPSLKISCDWSLGVARFTSPLAQKQRTQKHHVCCLLIIKSCVSVQAKPSCGFLQCTGSHTAVLQPRQAQGCSESANRAGKSSTHAC